MKAQRENWGNGDYMRRFPRIVAHIICGSLGYATPSLAAGILKKADRNEQHFCEWIMCCWKGIARNAVAQAIRFRRSHRGAMAHYPQAKALVDHANATKEEPLFASWF